MNLAEAKEITWDMRHIPGAVLYVSEKELDALSDELWAANPSNKGKDRPKFEFGSVLSTIYGVKIRKYGT